MALKSCKMCGIPNGELRYPEDIDPKVNEYCIRCLPIRYMQIIADRLNRLTSQEW